MSLKKFYEDNEIHRYSNFSNLKASPIESCNKVIENLLHRVMTAEKSRVWYTRLQAVASHLNGKKRKVLYGYSSNEAYDPTVAAYIRERYLEDYKRYKEKFRGQKSRYRVGETVRKVIDKTKFTRGYEQQWSKDLFVIRQIRHTYPKTYLLRNLESRRDLARAYYANELQRARVPDSKEDRHYFIEKSRVVRFKKLRSGKLMGGEKQWLLRSKNEDSPGRWIDSVERDHLIKNGLLL